MKFCWYVPKPFIGTRTLVYVWNIFNKFFEEIRTIDLHRNSSSSYVSWRKRRNVRTGCLKALNGTRRSNCTWFSSAKRENALLPHITLFERETIICITPSHHTLTFTPPNYLLTESKLEHRYTECLDIEPDHKAFNSKILCNRAAALQKLRRNAEALNDCNQAIAYDSNYTKAYLRRAQCFFDLGGEQNLEYCIRDYERIIGKYERGAAYVLVSL